MEKLNLKANGKIEIESENKIEISGEIETPQKLFLLLKKHKNKIENVVAETENFDKEILAAVSNCKNFHYKDKKDGIEVNRKNGNISIQYGNAKIYTSGKKLPYLSDNVSEMFHIGNTKEIKPLTNEDREKYKKLFQLYPLVKTENQIFDLTFDTDEYIKINRKVKNVPKISLIIGKEFVSAVINDKKIDEITFYSEFLKSSDLKLFEKGDTLLLKFKDTAIEFDDNDVMTCWSNGNEYSFWYDEMTDFDTGVSVEEMRQDLKEIKKLLKLSLKLIRNELIERMIKTVENAGELPEFESKMKILENFETL